ncbi:hypothetical protein KIN20_010188 [Parelaphostrongylus tenuis]|uniref:Uncharacterized protein n=1 Tax=Parelaphostrongylus tenuis TaxID=148309 RepID=A0AAD5MB22_PARTN|nr:hypothetical protein KIN20_010188 [Parelaphostrongylus tenuis]
MSTMTFNVGGFILTVAMTFSMNPAVRAQVVGISTSADAARAFVMPTAMQHFVKTFLRILPINGNSVFKVSDVLEQQGGAAGLADFIITSILDQLNVTISYAPQECKDVVISPDLAKMIIGNYDLPLIWQSQRVK